MVSHEIGLCRELLGYFGLFLIQFCKEGKFSGKKERKNLGQPGDGEGRYGQVLSPGNAGVTARGLIDHLSSHTLFLLNVVILDSFADYDRFDALWANYILK